jgi:hypothetical protein
MLVIITGQQPAEKAAQRTTQIKSPGGMSVTVTDIANIHL